MAPSLNMDPATAQPYNTARCIASSSPNNNSSNIVPSKRPSSAYQDSPLTPPGVPGSPTSSGGTISIYISNSKSIPTPSSTTRSTALSSPKKRRKTAHDQLPPWLRTSICVLAKSIDPLVHTASKQVDWERFNISLLVPSMEGPWDKALRNWPLDRLRGRMKDRHETNGFENLLNAASRLLFREVLINDLTEEQKTKKELTAATKRTNTISMRQLHHHTDVAGADTSININSNSNSNMHTRLNARHVLKLMLSLQQLKWLSKHEFDAIQPQLESVQKAANDIITATPPTPARRGGTGDSGPTERLDTSELQERVGALQKGVDGRLKRYLLPLWYSDYILKRAEPEFEYAVRLFVKGLENVSDFNWIGWAECLQRAESKWRILVELERFHTHGHGHDNDNNNDNNDVDVVASFTDAAVESIISVLLCTSDDELVDNGEKGGVVTELYILLQDMLNFHTSNASYPHPNYLGAPTPKTVPRSSIDCFIRSLVV